MRTTLLVAIAGAAGALSRYGLQALVNKRFPGAFPLGTFVVNISGAFALGVLFTALTERFAVAPAYRTAVGVGFLGAYTTFSTLAFETVRLFEDGAYAIGALNMLGSSAAGIVAVWAGIVVGRLL
jgi:CrcB protein